MSFDVTGEVVLKIYRETTSRSWRVNADESRRRGLQGDGSLSCFSYPLSGEAGGFVSADGRVDGNLVRT